MMSPSKITQMQGRRSNQVLQTPPVQSAVGLWMLPAIVQCAGGQHPSKLRPKRSFLSALSYKPAMKLISPMGEKYLYLLSHQLAAEYLFSHRLKTVGVEFSVINLPNQ